MIALALKGDDNRVLSSRLEGMRARRGRGVHDCAAPQLGSANERAARRACRASTATIEAIHATVDDEIDAIATAP